MALSKLTDPVMEYRLKQTIRDAVQQLLADQTADGAWHDCFEAGVMSDAQTAITLSILQEKDQAWTAGLLERLLSTQNANGSWGVHPEDDGDLSLTVESYYALKRYNRWEQYPEAHQKAASFILSRGGLKACRNLTKVFLAIGGEIPWVWLPSPQIYGFLFSRWSPISIFDIVAFTRLHIVPMIILSHYKYVEPQTCSPMLEHLITPDKRPDRARSPVFFPVLNLFNASFERRIIPRCRQFMLERREDDGSVAGYHSSTVLMLFALRALGYERQHREIRRALSALRRTYYTDETKRFYHQQTCDGHVWNTALAANALLGAGVKPEHPAIKGSVHYLLEKQHSRSGDWLRNNPVEPGGWGFSSNNTRHPDVDDTVAVLDVLAVCQNHGVKIGQPLQKGIRWLLGMQNDDGGWSAFDRNCNKQWMEKLPANDMERTIVDPSTADITGRVVDFLIRNQVVSPGSRVIHKAIRWLQENQEADGSWYGRWGTTYIYGTWCVLKGLCTAGVSSGDAALQRSKDWLLQIQRGDGGFGESCESALAGTFIPLHISLPSQTSWGLDALLHLYDVEKAPLEKHRLARACQRAARYLLNSGENGVWSEDMPTGTGFPGSLHIRYHIYPRVWPLAALAHYNRTFNQFDGYSHANLERR